MENESMKTTVILTGLRANGELHLGSLLGSILPMVRLQQSLADDQQLNMFVADLHSFTTAIDHASLYQNVLNNVRFYLAAGIDPKHERTTLYRQSFVPAHAELAWILECFTYFGEASRMTEFKDKSERLGHKTVTTGLFNYPMLMAADIFLYGATYVPLGDDQKQHIELIRTIAERLNKKFGEVVVVPATWEDQLQFAKREISVRIHSLSHPESKMSKSIDDPRGTIGLLDKPEVAYKKVMEATTDSVGTIQFDFTNQPGISNLLQLAALMSDTPLDTVITQWTGKDSYGQLKRHVAELVQTFLTGFQERYAQISDTEVETILLEGEIAARESAHSVLLGVQKAVGLRTK